MQSSALPLGHAALRRSVRQMSFCHQFCIWATPQAQNSEPARETARSPTAADRLSLGQAIFQLRQQRSLIQVLPNQHELVFGLPLPKIIFQGEALARQVKNVAVFAFLEPQNSLSPKDCLRHLIIQKALELADHKGAIALKGNGHKPIIF